MGQTLSEPVTDKITEFGSDESLSYAISCMQGWRITMEDAHIAVLNLKGSPPNGAEMNSNISLFGVFDGHGGDKVAEFTGKHLHDIILQQPSFKIGDYASALREAFLATDQEILKGRQLPMSLQNEFSGCTATVVLIADKVLYCANAGDSRTVLSVDGTAKALSFDHKPSNEGEKARIVSAGGFVDYGRVNGNLALSRAIGDFEFKRQGELAPEQQIVTALPDIITHELSNHDEFVVMACDGIWDCMTSQEVIDYVRKSVVQGQSLQMICENIMSKCLAESGDTGGVGCDNMTVAIVALLNGQVESEWANTIKEKAK
ncbi:protein phosphatase 2C [Ascobolus immersus RN42]|uniref:Protein phosphatase 2C homolog 2 n=1 Tax=Ascobolus immersus RN42 TaxID=1160509 RepID=A0A3N4IAV2_ASCIM|nr:protein phosphatase 2C [Ascobolus immersus RN42]